MRFTSMLVPAAMLAIAAVQPARAADAPPLSPFMVAVSVADLQKETDWYTAMFGATIEKDTDFAGGRVHFRWLRIGGQRLELIHSADAKDSNPPRPKPPGHAGLHGYTHFTMETPDLAATKAALLAKGATLAMDVTEVAPLGIKVIYLADPEGNAVEIAQRLTS